MIAIRNKLLFTTIVAALTACGGGDINVSPVTQDTSVDNSVTNSNNVAAPVTSVNCAFYINEAGQTIEGNFDGLDCIYASTFVDAGNNLTFDLTIPKLDNGGVHVFQGSLFVGETYDTDAKLAAAGISKGGDGPTLTIEAGATLAFTSTKQFLIVNRGSQIFAAGTQLEPITLTSISDVESGRAAAPTLAFDAVQQWGGVVINGFGITNKCAYTGTVAAGDLATTDCHVDAEGAAGLDESQYGGSDNTDSSGRLEYVIVKHPGAEVANGDELNGISFGGVGSNTIVNNLEVYSSYDDGIEMFGGAVNINNFVAMYVRDDSIDIDEGYAGTITNALVIQSETDGDHCIESDGVGSWTAPVGLAAVAQGLMSAPTINNLTCITSANTAATGTHSQGHGFLFREDIQPTINNTLMISAFSVEDPAAGNYCLRLDKGTPQAAQDGKVQLNSVIFACVEPTSGDTLPNLTTQQAWAESVGAQFATVVSADDVTATSNTALVLLEGTPAIYSVAFANMLVDGAAPTASAPVGGAAYIGALSTGALDWTAGWTYGIHAGQRAVDASGNDVALWFE